MVKVISDSQKIWVPRRKKKSVESEASFVTRACTAVTPVKNSTCIAFPSPSVNSARLAVLSQHESLQLGPNLEQVTRPANSITSPTSTSAYLLQSQDFQRLPLSRGQPRLEPSSSHHQHLQQRFTHLQQQQVTSPVSSTGLSPSCVPLSQPLTVVTSLPIEQNNELIRLLLLRKKALSEQQQQPQQQCSKQTPPASHQQLPSQQIKQQQFVSPQQLERQKQQDILRKQLLIRTLLKQQRERQLQQQQQQKQLGLHRSTSEGSFTYPSPPLREGALAGHRGSSGVISAPMTVNRAKANQGETRMEAYPSSSDLISPFINTCGDSTFSSDFMDASIYASSPNSLYIYEQEKMDMSSLGINTSCTTLDIGNCDEFDLKTSYEVSQDISSFPQDSAPSTSRPTSFNIISSNTEGMSWTDEKIMKDNDVYIKMETPEEAALTPTLAELNMNFDLLEDINSYISGEMSQNIISRPGECVAAVKSEPDSLAGRDVKPMIQRDSPRVTASSHSMLISALSGPLIHQTVVKTEPSDMQALLSGGSQESSRGVPYQKTFTPMTAVKPELIAPQRPTTVSASKPSQLHLDTIKEIDISDCRTLQNLLCQSRPLPARGANGSRRRTVSETQATMRKIPQATVPQRKRSVNAAGLESMDQKWEEIKEFLSMESSQMTTETATFPSAPPKRERKRYDSTSSVMTLTSNEDEDSDSDKDYDDDSDSDLEGGADLGSLNPDESLINPKEKQCFWQYNVQSKGPKGTRVHFEMEEDPHVLNDFEDPVFDPTNTDNLNTIGVTVRHGGKARKGDGNDIVPSPRKLCQIGLQLRKINRQINDFVPVSEMPFNARSKSRKEKNKLASRACRLKKKAQHEANKVKLHGLEMEHRKLLMVIRQIKRLMIARLKDRLTTEERKHTMTEHLDSLIGSNLDVMIAGNTTEYVNCVVHKVEAGDTTGGLKIKATRSYPLELQN